MSSQEHAGEESNAISELARKRVMAVLACLKVLCPGANRRTRRELASKILTLVCGKHRLPRKKIMPAAVYKMFTQNSQCVFNQAGRCPLLVFSQQFCEELNSFFLED